MPLNILGNIFHLVTNYIIRNFKSFCELILGGGLFLYLIDAYRQRKQQKILIRKLTKEVTFELFSQEVVLSTIISDFESLIKNPIEITGVHRLSLIVTEAILSSGYFVNFRHEFNDLLFNIYKRLKNIDFELDKFMSLPDKYKKINIKLLDSGKRHSIEAFENLQHSKIFINLKKKYLKEWLIKIKSEGELPEGVIIPKDDKIMNYWNGLLKEKAGLSKAIKIGQSLE